MTDTSIHILIVDDDAEYVDFIRHHLQSFQNKRFELTWANDGEKALDLLRSQVGIDLVLMDYFLPDTNGVEFIKRISQQNIIVPIILLTSNKDFRIAIEAMKYGVGDYLVKEDAVDTILPRAIVNVIERCKLGQKIAAAEKEKLLAQKKTEAVQELVVTMCHEFNNPLAAIKISTDILIRQQVSSEATEILSRLNQSISILENQIVKLRDINAEKAS